MSVKALVIVAARDRGCHALHEHHGSLAVKVTIHVNVLMP